MADTTQSVTASETEQVARANEDGLQPVVFIHGLWLLPSSWDRWAAVFEEAGYTALSPRLSRRSGHRPKPTPTPRSSLARPSARSPTTSPT